MISFYYQKAVARGAKSIKEPEEITDEDGTVIMATLATVSFQLDQTMNEIFFCHAYLFLFKQYGDVQHTLIERKNYKGLFLPGYKDSLTALRYKDPLETLL